MASPTPSSIVRTLFLMTIKAMRRLVKSELGLDLEDEREIRMFFHLLEVFYLAEFYKVN